MTDRPADIELADLYIRNELAGDEEADFELRMLQCPQLQRHVQTALAIKESLKLDEMLAEPSVKAHTINHPKRENSWGPMALAASVLLAVVSSVMLAKTSIETSQLKRQIAELSQPRTSVLTVPVNIMRSVGSGSPDVIVQKPSVDSIIQLDIELSRQLQAQPFLQFSLVSEVDGSTVSWQASPSANHRTTVMLRSEQLPSGRIQLHISDLDDNILDSRLLEFRPPLD